MIQNIFEKHINHSSLTKETIITIVKCFWWMKNVGTTLPKEIIKTVNGYFFDKSVWNMDFWEPVDWQYTKSAITCSKLTIKRPEGIPLTFWCLYC